MDKEFIGIICGVVGLIAIGSSTRVSSKLWSLILVIIGVASLSFSCFCLGYPFATGFLMGGILVWGLSFVFAKINGESIMEINWLANIVGTIIAIIGGWLLFK